MSIVSRISKSTNHLPSIISATFIRHQSTVTHATFFSSIPITPQEATIILEQQPPSPSNRNPIDTIKGIFKQQEILQSNGMQQSRSATSTSHTQQNQQRRMIASFTHLQPMTQVSQDAHLTRKLDIADTLSEHFYGSSRN